MKRLYIGAALLGATDDFKAKVIQLMDKLDDHFEVLRFKEVGKDYTSSEAYNRDINECIGTADLMLAIADYPSTGLGMEVMAAVKLFEIPTLVVYNKDNKISVLLEGLIDYSDNYDIIQYEDWNEIDKLIVSFEMEML